MVKLFLSFLTEKIFALSEFELLFWGCLDHCREEMYASAQGKFWIFALREIWLFRQQDILNYCSRLSLGRYFWGNSGLYSWGNSGLVSRGTLELCSRFPVTAPLPTQMMVGCLPRLSPEFSWNAYRSVWLMPSLNHQTLSRRISDFLSCQQDKIFNRWRLYCRHPQHYDRKQK